MARGFPRKTHAWRGLPRLLVIVDTGVDGPTASPSFFLLLHCLCLHSIPQGIETKKEEARKENEGVGKTGHIIYIYIYNRPRDSLTELSPGWALYVGTGFRPAPGPTLA